MDSTDEMTRFAQTYFNPAFGVEVQTNFTTGRRKFYLRHMDGFKQQIGTTWTGAEQSLRAIATAAEKVAEYRTKETI